ncbi:helix-turn-helix domain-containing protein [Terriglobus sp. ADX1]|uniref:helix-turn-helix domain-containing protein n=1 Tax=Terriglobus sp. ADX1 TaxID=2794063 RepID=UPI002FE6BD3F
MAAFTEVAALPCSPEKAEVYACASDDANAQARSLQGWSQLYDQISPGSFHGAIEGICTDSLHVFREVTNARLRQSCVVKSDAWWFGIPVREDVSFRLDARMIPWGEIAIRRGHQVFELMTPASFEIFGIVVERKKLEEHLRLFHDVAPPDDHDDLLRAAPHARTRLRTLLHELLSQTLLYPEVAQSVNAREAMEQSLMDAVADACRERSASYEVSKAERQQASLVRDVREYLLSLDDRVASVPELCRNFNISRRTLQYAFEQVLGMGPNAYLKLLRLNGVRRDLGRRRALNKSVQQVAADWGFWHLSQFSKDYKQHFLELPSLTLKRTQDARPR